MIIDPHAHLGTDLVFDEVRNEEDIIQKMADNEVDVTIVQPMFGAVYLEDIRAIHDRIYKFSQSYPKKIFGVASITPLIHEADYYNEAKRCIKDLGFVGIKLHPAAHGTSPMSKRGEMVWKVCSELGVPLMVHTGAGVPAALPANVIGRCKQFKDVQCILAHSGMISFAGEAILAASECPNVILETSWTAAHHIEHFIHLFGAERVLFAGDEGTNQVVELAKYRSLHITPEQMEWCLWKTANRVFHLKFS
jgi:predicted TIM-barrel fold metal-dependent hydrolase